MLIVVYCFGWLFEFGLLVWLGYCVVEFGFLDCGVVGNLCLVLGCFVIGLVICWLLLFVGIDVFMFYGSGYLLFVCTIFV